MFIISYTSSNGSTPVWDNISRSGARSIKISIPGATDSRSGYPKSDLMEAQPLSYYILSAWLKAEGAGGKNAPAVRVVELDSNRKWITQTNLAFDNGTYDWTEKKLTFRTGINTSYLYVYASIWEGYGTFWLDDVELSPFFGPTIYLNGALTQNPDGTVTQRARQNDIDFTFYYIPKERYIELKGEVQDLRGEDRALQVMFNVPVNLTGWYWNDDGNIGRRILDNSHYEVINKSEPFVSKYPFTSIDNGLDKGISIAHNPLSKGYNAYNTKSGYYQQIYTGVPFGIKSNANETNFSMVLYQSNAGFRSSETKYAEIYTSIDKPQTNATDAKKIIHATKEDFDAGTKIDVEVLKGGVITLKRKNLLDNPSFEEDNSVSTYNLDGLAENWEIYNPSGANYTTELDNTTFTNGSRSQIITFNSNSDQMIYLLQDLKNIDGGTQYTFTADLKINNPKQVEAYLYIESFNDTKWLKGYKSASLNSTNFTRISVTAITPSTSNRLKAIVLLKPKSAGAIGTLWVDSAQLEIGGNATNYIEEYESLNGEYISAPIDMGETAKPYMFKWTTSVKTKGNIRIQVRSSANLDDLNSSQWYGPIMSEDYYSYSQNEWKINSVHNNSRWIQYKAYLSSNYSAYSPSVHDIMIKYGASIPEVHWINVLDNNGNQKYAFKTNETANFKVEIFDFKGISNIESVNISIYYSNVLVLQDIMVPGEIVNDIERYYEYNYNFPLDASLGLWNAEIKIRNKEGQIFRENATLKVKETYTSVPQKMTLGVLAADYGFKGYKNYNETIEAYSKYEEIEIWKLGLSWDILEPERGDFNEEYIQAILKFIDAAQNKGARVQIGIAQQWWPAWVNNGNWDDKVRYRYETTTRLADTWMLLAKRIKDHPGFDSYLIVAEENYVYDEEDYLQGLNKITSSIRSVDGNLSHRITIRPNTVNSYIRSRIAHDGIQDYEYGTGVYPTSSAWYLDTYENPISNTSYLKMSNLRSSPLAYGGADGLGEIGFMKASNDRFGDEEKLLGFERAMSIAYDQGMDEFMLWEGSFSFKDPEVYFLKLKEFRDNLTKQPRLSYFNVRVLIDNYDWLFKSSSSIISKINMSDQPYFYLIKTLDEKGYSWFYTHKDAELIQNLSFNVTIKLSEIKGKNESEQNKIIFEKLGNITSSGKYYPWPNN